MSLVRKWNKSVTGVINSENAYNALNASADPEMLEEWREVERKALEDREHNPAAMDVYEASIDKGENCRTPVHC